MSLSLGAPFTNPILFPDASDVCAWVGWRGALYNTPPSRSPSAPALRMSPLDYKRGISELQAVAGGCSRGRQSARAPLLQCVAPRYTRE